MSSSVHPDVYLSIQSNVLARKLIGIRELTFLLMLEPTEKQPCMSGSYSQVGTPI